MMKDCTAACCFALFLVVLAFTLDAWSYRCKDGDVDCDASVDTKAMKITSASLYTIAAVVFGYCALVSMDVGMPKMLKFW